MTDPYEVIKAVRLVPVVVLEDADAAEPLGAALKAGGLPVAEVTFRTAAAQESLRRMAADPELFVGAGTVVRAEQVDLAVKAGARFIVSPGLSATVVRRAQELGVPVFPGVATPTEIMAALDLGLTTVKLFPAESLGGISTVKALAAPFPQVTVHPDRRHQGRAAGVLPGGSLGGRDRRLLDGRVVPGGRGRLRRDHPTDRRGGRDSCGGFRMSLTLRPAESCAFDAISLGEVMLRLDPGEGRVRTTRSFRVWEGGGEYNVTRGLRRCFGLRTGVVTALADNEVGRLVEDLILTGGVDTSFVRWVPYDGVGRSVRNGLNFTERGFGVRGATGTSDRGHTAASQLKPGDIDWEHLFGELGVRWFHTGGIYAGLSETTPDVVAEAMAAARRHGTVISYDLNYRPSIWKAVGGKARAQEVNRELARSVDVMIGNEEDFTACLGFEVPDTDPGLTQLETDSLPGHDRPGHRRVHQLLRRRDHAARRRVRDRQRLGRHRLVARDRLRQATHRPALEILDRVGGGDSFASGLVYGLMTTGDLAQAVEYGAAHGALAMTTPGDTSMASLAEVEALDARRWGAGAAVNGASIGYVDAHHHLWSLTEHPQTWMGTSTEMTPIHRDFTAQEYGESAQPAGVTSSVLVQSVNDAEETQHLLNRAAAYPMIEGVVGFGDLTSESLSDQLAAWREGPGGHRLVGLRHLVTEEADPELAGPP